MKERWKEKKERKGTKPREGRKNGREREGQKENGGRRVGDWRKVTSLQCPCFLGQWVIICDVKVNVQTESLAAECNANLSYKVH